MRLPGLRKVNARLCHNLLDRVFIFEKQEEVFIFQKQEEDSLSFRSKKKILYLSEARRRFFIFQKQEEDSFSFRSKKKKEKGTRTRSGIRRRTRRRTRRRSRSWSRAGTGDRDKVKDEG